MSGFNFDNFQESKSLLVPADQPKIPLTPPLQNPEPQSRKGDLVQQASNTVANVAGTVIVAQNPTILILKVIDDALQIIPNLAACYSAIVIAKEETQRIRLEVDGNVRIAELELQKFVAEQQESTERLRIQCENNLDRWKTDLLQLEKQLKAEEYKAKNQKEILMAILEQMDKTTNFIIKSGRSLTEHLCNNYMNMPSEERMCLYSKIQEIGNQLVALSQNITSLRGQVEPFNGG